MFVELARWFAPTGPCRVVPVWAAMRLSDRRIASAPTIDVSLPAIDAFYLASAHCRWPPTIWAAVTIV